MSITYPGLLWQCQIVNFLSYFSHSPLVALLFHDVSVGVAAATVVARTLGFQHALLRAGVHDIAGLALAAWATFGRRCWRWQVHVLKINKTLKIVVTTIQHTSISVLFHGYLRQGRTTALSGDFATIIDRELRAHAMGPHNIKCSLWWISFSEGLYFFPYNNVSNSSFYSFRLISLRVPR